MKQQSYTTVILRADDGMVLTEVADVELTKRTFASEIALGRNDTPDSWREIPREEADTLRQQQRAELDRLDAEREARMQAEMNAGLIEDVEPIDNDNHGSERVD